MTLQSDTHEQQLHPSSHESSFFNFGTPLELPADEPSFLGLDPTSSDSPVFDLLEDLDTSTQNAEHLAQDHNPISNVNVPDSSNISNSNSFQQYSSTFMSSDTPFSNHTFPYVQEFTPQTQNSVFHFQPQPQQYQPSSFSSLQFQSASSSSAASSPSSLDLEQTAPPVVDNSIHARKRRALRRKKRQTKHQTTTGSSNNTSDSDGDSDKSSKRGKKRKREDMADHEWKDRQAERRKKNRVSAQQSRERHKLYVSNLETQVDELSTQNTSLTAKLASLENQNAIMRERLMELEKKHGNSASVPPPTPSSATPVFLPGLLWHLWSSTGPQSGRKRTSTGRTATVLLVAVLAFALLISTGQWPLSPQAKFDGAPTEHLRFKSRSLLASDDLSGKLKLDQDAASLLLDSMPDNLNFTVDQKAATLFFSQIMSSFSDEGDQKSWFADFEGDNVSVKQVFSSLLTQLEGKTTRIDDRALKERVLHCLHQTADKMRNSPEETEPPSFCVKTETPLE